MKEDIFSELEPDTDRTAAGRYYSQSKKWKNFAINICRNFTVVKLKLEEQEGKCFCCRKDIDVTSTILHHTTYLWECCTDKSHYAGGLKKGRRPPCKGCAKIAICSSFVVAVCDDCHEAIHLYRSRVKRLKDISEIK
jgi:hypothetical protein